MEKPKADDEGTTEQELGSRKTMGLCGHTKFDDGSPVLDPVGTTLLRAVAERANYLRSDRAGIAVYRQ